MTIDNILVTVDRPTAGTRRTGGTAMGWAKKSASIVKVAPRLTMAAAHVFTRYTHPRYEVRGAAGGAVPCANVPHVVEELRRLGTPRITDAMVYKLTRDGGEGCRAARLLPAGVTVHKLSAAERWERPLFRVTRAYELADSSDVAAAAA